LLAVLVYLRIRGIGLVGLDTLPILAQSEFPESLGRRLLPHHNMYRPVTSLSVALDKGLFGLSASGFQLTNAVCYLGAGLALGWAALRLAGTRRAAAVAVLAFLLHPAQVDVVPAVERRSELLLVAFTALVVASVVRALERPSALARLAPALYACLALGSKDNGVIVLPIACATALLYAEGGLLARARQAAWAVAPLSVATALFLFCRSRIVGGLGGQSDRDPLASLAQHPRLLATHLDRILRPEPFASTEVVTGILVALAAVLFAAAGWRARGTPPQGRRPLLGTGGLGTGVLGTALVGLAWIECVLVTYTARGIWRLWYVVLPAAGLALVLAGAVEALALWSATRARPIARAALAALVLAVGWQARHSVAFGSLERAHAAHGRLLRRARGAPSGRPARHAGALPRPARHDRHAAGPGLLRQRARRDADDHPRLRRPRLPGPPPADAAERPGARPEPGRDRPRAPRVLGRRQASPVRGMIG
jgi:hypothetical protein